MAQSEQVLEHDYVQMLLFIWSLYRNYQTGVSTKGYGSGSMNPLPTSGPFY